MPGKTLDEFAKEYRPYNTMREFWDGTSAYHAGNSRNPHRAGSVQAQAWACGFDCLYRFERQRDGAGGPGVESFISPKKDAE
jgi:hypothetical protein